MENRRLNYIDWAKAVSIVLIVLGHMLPASCWPKVLIYAFHVPIFAIIGGMLHKVSNTWCEVGKRSLGFIVRILIPYIIWFCIFSIFYFLPAEFIPKVISKSLDLKTIIKCFVFLEKKTIWNAAMWFIPCYFIVSLLFIVFTRLTRGNRYFSLGLSIFLFATVIILEKLEIEITLFDIKNAFGIKNYFLLFGFLAFGHFVRPLIDSFANLIRKSKMQILPYVLAAIFIAVSVICLKHNEIEPTKSKPGGYYTLSFYSGLYNGILYYVLFAILLSILLILIFTAFPKSKIAERLSRGSFFIMLTHYFVFLEESFLSFPKAEWIKDMNIGFRDTAFIMMIYVVLFYFFDLLSHYKIARVILPWIGYIPPHEAKNNCPNTR